MATYLYFFAKYKIRTLPKDRKERDFFVFLQMVKEPKLVLDIGANIGIMTYHISKKCPKAKVISYEPIPHNINTLNRVVEHYNLTNVIINKSAVGNQTGNVKMVMPIVHAAKMQGLSHVVHPTIDTFNEGAFFEVPIIRLDDALKNRKAPVDAIKMDVENFEFFVLEGAKEILSTDKPIIYTELWENQNRKKCFELLLSLGYRIMVAEEGLPVRFDEKRHKVQNFIFIAEDCK